ncbi:hypothetical protein EDEG_01820 [Edhazardia aedis USNM 41457]|uniref:tRNA 4-demethylwyosine synthase (AdoMet-dependent) n=1 Tax=Edhazardia aedis (strain USNM 41457) TaxID=1003232 RepID=J9DRC8_EDHAE|nr:hypothetical protein EDEG_01820 [Edhazardia aedis USNM 41457]|eukprot:EJW03892.1 hypothetical protein EDEG_01820 [Edhazardia aedis USNM 41457]
MVQIKILYATETGKSLKYASDLSQKLNFPHEVLCFSDYELSQEKALLIIIVSTFFDGKPPVNGQSLYQQLEDLKNDFRVERNYLKNYKIAIFGLGSLAYDSDFNIVARNMQKFFKDLGAKIFLKTGLGDEYNDMDTKFLNWTDKLINRIDFLVKEEEAESVFDSYEDIEEAANLDIVSLEKDSYDQNVDIEDIDKKMLNNSLSKNLEKQGYKLVGSHSAVKLCRWTKSMLKGHGGCYKHTFYGISSLSCMEITPSLACANKCVFCWRHYTNPVSKTWKWKTDDPLEIFNGLKNGHLEFINRFRHTPNVDPLFFENAQKIKHCALSLVGEPIMYPRINELIDILHKNKISTFVVTNAQFPDELTTLKPVTQLYLSIDASNEGDLKSIDRPLHNDFWERFIKCIDIIKNRKERTVFRLTVVKGKNMNDFDGYKNLIKRGMPDFIEVKGVTFCGYKNKDVMNLTNVPFHFEVVEFCKAILIDDYEIACAHDHSCCVLIAHKKFKSGKIWKTWIDYDLFFAVMNKEDLSSVSYNKPTPSWSEYGSFEKGFDPNLTPKIRSKNK